MTKPCPKSPRCSPGGRWKLHLALIDLDEQGIDARIADMQSSPTMTPDYFLGDAVRSNDGGKTWVML